MQLSNCRVEEENDPRSERKELDLNGSLLFERDLKRRELPGTPIKGGRIAMDGVTRAGARFPQRSANYQANLINLPRVVCGVEDGVRAGHRHLRESEGGRTVTALNDPVELNSFFLDKSRTSTPGSEIESEVRALHAKILREGQDYRKRWSVS